jgi:hypothetical protein
VILDSSRELERFSERAAGTEYTNRRESNTDSVILSHAHLRFQQRSAKAIYNGIKSSVRLE